MTARDAPAALVAIVGATAVGKTALTMALAAEFDAEIISADSRQVFCGLDIGTAKPTKTERMQVPHHVIDVAPADNTSFSLAVWRSMRTVRCWSSLHDRNGHGSWEGPDYIFNQ